MWTARPVEKREFLRAHLGKPICSVIQEGIALKISADEQQKGFEPSVPFTACFSACMVVAEMVAHVMKWPSALAPRFQFDFLMGPQYGQELPQGRRPAASVHGIKTSSERAQLERPKQVTFRKLKSPESDRGLKTQRWKGLRLVLPSKTYVNESVSESSSN